MRMRVTLLEARSSGQLAFQVGNNTGKSPEMGRQFLSISPQGPERNLSIREREEEHYRRPKWRYN